LFQLLCHVRIEQATPNIGLESPAHEICGHLLRAYPELFQEEADTCTSELEVGIRTSAVEAGTRMSELEAGTSTSGEEADIRTSELGADTRVSQVEAGTCIPSAVADSRLRAVEALDVARPYSIAAARRRCMQPAVSGYSSMTSPVV
jgi:hypothetical protein